MILNLTPHPVVLVSRDGASVTLPPDGRIPRVDALELPLGHIEVDTITVVPVRLLRTGAVTELPDPVPGVQLIVSRMVAEAAPHRRDLLVPLDQVRDEQDRIVAAAALGQVPDPLGLEWEFDDHSRLMEVYLPDGRKVGWYQPAAVNYATEQMHSEEDEYFDSDEWAGVIAYQIGNRPIEYVDEQDGGRVEAARRLYEAAEAMSRAAVSA